METFKARFYRLRHLGERYQLSVLHLWNCGVWKWTSGLLRPNLYMNQTCSEDDHWKRSLPPHFPHLPLGFRTRCLEFGSCPDSFIPPLFTGDVLESSLLFQSLWEQDGGTTWANTKREGERVYSYRSQVQEVLIKLPHKKNLCFFFFQTLEWNIFLG